MSATTAVDPLGHAGAGNGRAAPRTFLMLAAMAGCAGGYLPVRIRNVSETGALIEGDGLPQAGEILHLSRGETEIDAVIAWASGNRRGIRFAGPVPVDTWRAGKPVAAPVDQGRVDSIQAAARAGRRSAPPPPSPAPAHAGDAPWVDQLEVRLAEELAFVRRLVETLGDQLVADPAVLHRHTQALQNIDLASQILGHLSRVVGAADPAEAVQAIGMDDLRARLTRHRTLAA
jgi:hypothetical protein